jgi:hypothetical protein
MITKDIHYRSHKKNANSYNEQLMKGFLNVAKRDYYKSELIVEPSPEAVRTIKDLIYWEYSKLIAKAAEFDKDYGSIMSRAKLKSGQINFSELDKDDRAAIKSSSIL